MKRRSTLNLAIAATTAAVMAAPAVASATKLTGTVVQRNARTHSFVVANRAGRLYEVHARREPAVGRHVVVTASRLRNGTWAARRLRQGGRARRARIHGTVTYSSLRTQSFVVSARGVSLLVHRRIHRRAGQMLAAVASASSSTLPTVGTDVTVNAELSGNEVSSTHVSDLGTNTNGIDLEGVVLSVDTTASTISISADDSEQSGASITVQIPTTFDITQFHVGDKVELTVSLNPDGTYTLEQSSGDGSAQQAENPGDQQGNPSSDQQPSAAQQCTAQANDPNFPATHNGQTFAEYYAINPNEPNSAFGDCVDALSSDGGQHANAAQQCLAQRSDPGFPAAHNGESFLQYYSSAGSEASPGDAFGHCVDLAAQQDTPSSGASGGTSGDAGAPSSGSAGGSDS